MVNTEYYINNNNYLESKYNYCNYCMKEMLSCNMFDLETCNRCNEIENSKFNFNKVLRNGFKYLSELKSKVIINKLRQELEYNLKILNYIDKKEDIIYKDNKVNIFDNNGLILNEIAYELQYRINNIINNLYNIKRSY